MLEIEQIREAVTESDSSKSSNECTLQNFGLKRHLLEAMVQASQDGLVSYQSFVVKLPATTMASGEASRYRCGRARTYERMELTNGAESNLDN